MENTSTKTRCAWAGNDPIYQHYHDVEWGKPKHNDDELFELLILEGFQAGLSWITILKKRENFREAFHQFDYQVIAKYNDDDFSRLLQNAGIVRNKLKIRAAKQNALAFIDIQKAFGSFSDYFWAFSQHQIIRNNFEDLKEVPASTLLSERISKDLKKRGFKFVGPTIVYAFMQSMGMVNDHVCSCDFRD
ncbi:MAG: DNA-3-methyladenine glycosylase I [Flavobacteriales bacterium]